MMKRHDPPDGMWRLTFSRAQCARRRSDPADILACRDFELTPKEFFQRSGYADAVSYRCRYVHPLKSNRAPDDRVRPQMLLDLALNGPVGLRPDTRFPILLLGGKSGVGKTLEQLALLHAVTDPLVRAAISGHAQQADPSRVGFEHAGRFSACFVDCTSVGIGHRGLREIEPARVIALLIAHSTAYRDDCANDLARAEATRRLLRNSPPTMFMFDLNRATPDDAEHLAFGLRHFADEFCQPRGGSNQDCHRLIVAYRTISQLTDKVWDVLQPGGPGSPCNAFELRDIISMDAALSYFHAARHRWHERRGVAASLIERQSETDAAAFIDLIRSCDTIVGLPLLLQMASTEPDLQTVRSAIDLLDRFLERWYARESREAPNRQLAIAFDDFRILATRLALEMLETDALELDSEHAKRVLASSAHCRGEWAKRAVFAKPLGTGARSDYVRRQFPARGQRSPVRQFLEHGPVTESGSGQALGAVRFVHDRFRDYLAGTAARDILGPSQPITLRSPATWAGEVAAWLHARPERWKEPVAFLARCVARRPDASAAARQLLWSLLRRQATSRDHVRLLWQLLRNLDGLNRSDEIVAPIWRFIDRERSHLESDPQRLVQELCNEWA